MKNHNPRPGLFIWKHWVCLILVLILMQVSCNYFDPLNPYGHIIYWAKSYGASNDEQINTITPLSDGNVIAGGYTYSFGTGGQDAWLIRLDQEGKVTWEKAYGTEMNEEICSICPTSDHNFIVAGYMDNTDDDYMNDIWVMKCDNEGNKLWEERFGRDQVEKAMWIEETQEGDYIIAGKSNTFVGTGIMPCL
jgi:hypothetical protein